MGRCWRSFWNEAGLPDDVLQVVQGDRVIGSELVISEIDGVLFTGSYTGGCAIHRQLAGRPEVLLALEMGGNNPLIIADVADLDAAAMTCVISAYITAGQRCTCARKLILPASNDVEPLLNRIRELAESIVIGPPESTPEPFIGPVISAEAGQQVIAAQQAMLDEGAIAILPCQSQTDNSAFVSPGLIDVTECRSQNDTEVFGPLLKIIRVNNFENAVSEANASAFGLAAGLISDSTDKFDYFRKHIRAGVVNWNQPTVGASGQLPFGGFGASGNYRPSGSAAVEYCCIPSAGIESATLSNTPTHYPGLQPASKDDA